MWKATLSLSVYVIGGIVWFKILWIEVVIYSVLLLGLCMLLDIITGFLLARKNKQVSSERFINGVAVKWGIWSIIAIVSSASWHIAYIFNNQYIWIAAYVIIWLFVFWEITSLVENLRWLNWGNKYENKLLDLLYIIFNFWFEKWTKKLEDEAKKKIDKLLERNR